MINEEYVYKVVSKIKKDISKCLLHQKLENALTLVSLCARVLYTTAIYYKDDDLESAMQQVALSLWGDFSENRDEYKCNGDVILFYDGFGLNERGLAQIYLDALCKEKKVVYVTYSDRKDLIPDIEQIVARYNGELRYIRRKNQSFIKQTKELINIIDSFCPEGFFYYSTPDDVVGTQILYIYAGLIKRYFINLTDHSFWIGVGALDKCIEFREYGARVSHEYRDIPKEKITIVPMYPKIHEEREFLGFPFEKRADQKVFFSGGALYKTLGGANKYYEIVDHILEVHQDTIFWYAGSGDDSQMQLLMNKYPNRVFLSAERSDLFQILERCEFYLSTYPISGGLMFQYAALAGCVPVTLKKDEDSEGFLIKQETLGIEFNDTYLLYEEVNRLLDDCDYHKQRSVIMKKSVVTEDAFEKEVKQLFEETSDDWIFPIYEHIDTESFRNEYLNRLTKNDLDRIFVAKKYRKVTLTRYPLKFLMGSTSIAWKMFARFFKK